MKYPALAFREIGICCKNSKATAVKMRRLSIPAQGQAIANFAVPIGPVVCRVGMPFSVPSKVVDPIKPRTPAASVAVVGTKIWNGVNSPLGKMLSILYITPTKATNKVGKEKLVNPFFPKDRKIIRQKRTAKARYSIARGIVS